MHAAHNQSSLLMIYFAPINEVCEISYRISLHHQINVNDLAYFERVASVMLTLYKIKFLAYIL